MWCVFTSCVIDVVVIYIYILCRLSNEETNQDKMMFVGRDSDAVELESKQSKKLGKSRRIGKMEFPIDCGADAEGDHNGPGVPSSREEKVSSLKTVSSEY